jgi:hypothetical protein
MKKVADEVEQLHDRRFDPLARKRLRELMAANYGLFGQLDSIQAQLEYLSTDGTVSAFDNELALVWWKYYSRAKWQLNPLNVRYNGPHPPVLMVSRLDGPQEGTAAQIILGSLKAEKEGLSGRVVIDSMGGTAARRPAGQGGRLPPVRPEAAEPGERDQHADEAAVDARQAARRPPAAQRQGRRALHRLVQRAELRAGVRVQGRRGRLPHRQLRDAQPPRGQREGLGRGPAQRRHRRYVRRGRRAVLCRPCRRRTSFFRYC